MAKFVKTTDASNGTVSWINLDLIVEMERRGGVTYLDHPATKYCVNETPEQLLGHYDEEVLP